MNPVGAGLVFWGFLMFICLTKAHESLPATPVLSLSFSFTNELLIRDFVQADLCSQLERNPQPVSGHTFDEDEEYSDSRSEQYLVALEIGLIGTFLRVAIIFLVTKTSSEILIFTETNLCQLQGETPTSLCASQQL